MATDPQSSSSQSDGKAFMIIEQIKVCGIDRLVCVFVRVHVHVCVYNYLKPDTLVHN